MMSVTESRGHSSLLQALGSRPENFLTLVVRKPSASTLKPSIQNLRQEALDSFEEMLALLESALLSRIKAGTFPSGTWLVEILAGTGLRHGYEIVLRARILTSWGRTSNMSLRVWRQTSESSFVVGCSTFRLLKLSSTKKV